MVHEPELALSVASSLSARSSASSSCVRPNRVGDTSIPPDRLTLSTMSTIRQSTLPVSVDKRRPRPTCKSAFKCPPYTHHLSEEVATFRRTSQDDAVNLFPQRSPVLQSPRPDIPRTTGISVPSVNTSQLTRIGKSPLLNPSSVSRRACVAEIDDIDRASMPADRKASVTLATWSRSTQKIRVDRRSPARWR